MTFYKYPFLSLEGITIASYLKHCCLNFKMTIRELGVFDSRNGTSTCCIYFLVVCIVRAYLPG